MTNNRNQKFLAITLFYFIFGLVPLGLWIITPGRQIIIYDWFFFLTTIARASALVGITIFAGNLLLSGRYKFLDNFFGGLDTVFRFHRQTGFDVWALLTIHVTAIVARMGIFYVQTNEWYGFQNGPTISILLGILSYAGLISIIVLSIVLSGKVKYERLRYVHKFLGMVLAVGALHAMLLSVSFSANFFLEVYMIGLIFLSGVSYLFRTILWQFFNNRHSARISSVKNLGSGVIEVAMTVEDGEKISFIPGQFIFIGFNQEGFGKEDHPFSLTGSSSESNLRIAVKDLGDFTHQLSELQVGSSAFIQGPFGGFSFVRSKLNEQIWIAGGIGITPFISMARTMADNVGKVYDQYTITLYYSVQKDDDLVYLKELRQIEKKCPGFSVVPWVSDREGYISAESISKKQGINNIEFFICGPPPMMQAIVKQLGKAGVSNHNIHIERFDLL